MDGASVEAEEAEETEEAMVEAETEREAEEATVYTVSEVAGADGAAAAWTG